MGDPDVAASHLVGVEVPAVLLEFFDCSTDVFVVADLYAHVFFHCYFTFVVVRISKLVKRV